VASVAARGKQMNKQIKGDKMKVSDRVIAERDRLVGWVMNDAGERVTLRQGNRIKFTYKDRVRVGTVLCPHPGGFRLREDGDATPKLFNRDGVTGLVFLTDDV
jgi:hypothetical protein